MPISWVQKAVLYLCRQQRRAELDAAHCGAFTKGWRACEAHHGIGQEQPVSPVSDEQRIDALVYFAANTGRLMKQPRRVQ